MRRFFISCLLFVGVGTLLLITIGLDGHVSDQAQAGQNDAQGLAAWAKAYEVFSHPRCSNCHVADDKPRWSGPSYGPTAEFHGMNVVADASRDAAGGLACKSCHGAENLPFPKGAPGAPHWALAPVEMAWWDKSAEEICLQIKDPERNGGRTVEQVTEHIVQDALVQWGWAPGPGREAAPYSAAELAHFLSVWNDVGAPCPSG